VLIGDALATRGRDNLQISVNSARSPIRQSMVRLRQPPRGGEEFPAYSLQRLRVDHIDIYAAARLDRRADRGNRRAMADMIKAGWIRHIGLSEVGSETIRRAHAVHPIADLQIEYSLIARGIESDILKPAASSASHHRLWRAVARADQRSLVEGSHREGISVR